MEGFDSPFSAEAVFEPPAIRASFCRHFPQRLFGRTDGAGTGFLSNSQLVMIRVRHEAGGQGLDLEAWMAHVGIGPTISATPSPAAVAAAVAVALTWAIHSVRRRFDSAVVRF